MSLNRNITANYLGRAYSIGSIYIFVPFYITILGVESYGLIAFYSIILSLTALADVGLSSAFAREAARTNDKRGLLDLLATIEGTLLLSTGAVAAIVFHSAEYITNHWLNIGTLQTADTIICLRIMAATLPFQLAISLYIGGLLGLQRQTLANIMLAIYTTLRSGLVILPILIVADIKLFFLWQFLAAVFCFFLARGLLLHRLDHRPFVIGKFSPSTMLPVLGFAGGMLAITVISALNTQLDKIVVSNLFSVEQFGYYTLASTLAQIPYALTAPILVALLPRWTSLVAEGSFDELALLYDSHSFLISLLSSIGAFGLLFFTADVSNVWLQQAKLPEVFVQVTMILATGGLFLSLAALPFYFGLAHGHNRTSIFLGGVTLFLTTPLLLVASPRFGLIGAAFPWVALNAITLCVLLIVVNRRFHSNRVSFWTWKVIIFPVCVGAITMALARLGSNILHLNPLGSCILAGVFGTGVAAVAIVRVARPTLLTNLLKISFKGSQ